MRTYAVPAPLDDLQAFARALTGLLLSAPKAILLCNLGERGTREDGITTLYSSASQVGERHSTDN